MFSLSNLEWAPVSKILFRLITVEKLLLLPALKAGNNVRDKHPKKIKFFFNFRLFKVLKTPGE